MPRTDQQSEKTAAGNAIALYRPALQSVAVRPLWNTPATAFASPANARSVTYVSRMTCNLCARKGIAMKIGTIPPGISPFSLIGFAGVFEPKRRIRAEFDERRRRPRTISPGAPRRKGALRRLSNCFTRPSNSSGCGQQGQLLSAVAIGIAGGSAFDGIANTLPRVATGVLRLVP